MTPHPCYSTARRHDRQLGLLHYLTACIGDEVSAPDGNFTPLGTVVGIGLDGMVELSTGDVIPAADLVLMRRGEA
ncbi:MAG: hypothetical protein ACRCW4_00450 [Candidatus Neomicrothrix subdominans]